MLKTFMLTIKRKRLMKLFDCFDVKYHTQHLGKAMADADDEFNREYHHKKLREGIQEICEKHKINRDDLRLIEDDLNEYINGLVNKAQDEETQKRKVREFVDNRIKIKRVERQGLNGNSPTSEPEPES